jgi:uncharacterized spore protein YtfJ
MSVNTMEAPTSKADEVRSTIEGVRDALTVGRVFGDPYEVDGITVIPVARVTGGAGGGGGESTDDDAPGSGFGSGFGMDARPVGVYEVHDGEVTWKPAVDVTRLARSGQVLAGIALICLTLVLLRRSS